MDLIAIDWRGNIKYRLASKDHNNVQIRKQQYQSLNDSRSGYLAKKFIESKIKNQKATLGALSRARGGVKFLELQKNKLNNLEWNKIFTNKDKNIKLRHFVNIINPY